MELSLNSYQKQAIATAVYPKELAVTYPLLGLAGEAGETANKWKKYLRGDHGPLGDETARKRGEYAAAKELGGALWYIAAAASDMGFTLEEIATANLGELKSRAERGTIRGSGDDR